MEKHADPSASHSARITRPARGAEGREGHGSGALGEGLRPHAGCRAYPESKTHVGRNEGLRMQQKLPLLCWVERECLCPASCFWHLEETGSSLLCLADVPHPFLCG